MRTMSASEAKNRLGQAIDAALAEPLILTKKERPAVVMLSVAEYQRLVAVDEGEMLRRAVLSEKAGYLSPEESESLLNTMVDNK